MARRYHTLTGYYRRQKWREKLTREIDLRMKAHRESLWQIGPRSPQYEVYAEHILMHFNDAIVAYTQYEYALQDFLQYSATNKFLDQLATKLIASKRTFVFVGNAFLPANSPAKVYRRNKIKGLFEKMARRRLCIDLHLAFRRGPRGGGAGAGDGAQAQFRSGPATITSALAVFIIGWISVVRQRYSSNDATM